MNKDGWDFEKLRERKTSIESLADLLPEIADPPFYILFSDDTFMMFTATSFHSMLRKLKVTIQEIKTIGRVEYNKWVCFHFDGEVDVFATNLMRRRFGV
jgi:hypothetical protein